MEEDVGASRTLLDIVRVDGWSLVFSIGFTAQLSLLVTQQPPPLFFSPGVVLVMFLLTAALGKMMEEIEINLPRFDQCIR